MIEELIIEEKAKATEIAAYAILVALNHPEEVMALYPEPCYD